MLTCFEAADASAAATAARTQDTRIRATIDILDVEVVMMEDFMSSTPSRMPLEVGRLRAQPGASRFLTDALANGTHRERRPKVRGDSVSRQAVVEGARIISLQTGDRFSVEPTGDSQPRQCRPVRTTRSPGGASVP
jgi:hypothetical protein